MSLLEYGLQLAAVQKIFWGMIINAKYPIFYEVDIVAYDILSYIEYDEPCIVRQ